VAATLGFLAALFGILVRDACAAAPEQGGAGAGCAGAARPLKRVARGWFDPVPLTHRSGRCYCL